MKKLDCETIDSTYESLEQILGTTRSRLESLFDGLDIESFYRNKPHHPQSPEDLIFSEVRKLATLEGDNDRTCWFHLTRTLVTNTFEQGILPLGKCLDAIWNLLYSLARKHVSVEEWDEFRRDMGSHDHAGLYEMKVSDPREWGPFALLIKDHAFRSKEIGNHDYLGVPEIVEDICMCFTQKHGFDLLAAFTKKTKPCIVKFFAGPRSDCVETAIYHLYKAHRGEKCSIQCNTCYDAEGVPVAPDRIMNVEFPTYRTGRRRKMSSEAKAISWKKAIEDLLGAA
jgi:hypothetical protein